MMKYRPQVGHFLHASCSDETVYEIIGSGEDANGHPTIDVKCFDLNEILHFAHDNDAKGNGSDGKWDGKWSAPLTYAELPDSNVQVILRDMQYRLADTAHDNCVRMWVNAPEGGCYRCCYVFSVCRDRGGRSRVVDPATASS